MTMRRLFVSCALVAATVGGANAAIIIDNTIAGSVTNDFAGLPDGSVAGFISQTGATYSERFAGQTLSTAGGFDALTGTPTGPLTSVANGVVDDNIGTFLETVYGDLSATVGEGALSILLDTWTDVIGFNAVGTDGGGSILVQFFDVDGNLLGSHSQTAADQFYGFRATGGEMIRGISITNTDPAGMGFDDVTFNQRVGTVPEPGTVALLGLGLAGLAAWRRRRP